MSRMVSIYALCDPDTGDVRYIGQTVNTKRRLYEHINATRRKQATHSWINSLISQSKRSLMKVIAVVDWHEANLAELRHRECTSTRYKPREWFSVSFWWRTSMEADA